MKISFSPLQLFSPILLIFCFVLFFVPWVALEVVPPKDIAKNMPKELLQTLEKKGMDPTKTRTFLTQSGLQIANGGYTFGEDELKRVPEIQQKAPTFGELMGDRTNKESHSAPLLFLFPVGVFVAMVIGFVPIQHLFRRLALAACCLAVVGVVGLQLTIGTPLNRGFERAKEKRNEARRAAGKDINVPTESQPRVVWRFPLYLTFLFLLGATATAFVDGALLAGAKRSKSRSRARDEDADEDDEDEDERPRKRLKSRSRARDEDDDEDEEDERPRKKKKLVVEQLPDEDDDVEPPKKKPARRDDDEEEDDRPRKKRPRRDD